MRQDNIRKCGYIKYTRNFLFCSIWILFINELECAKLGIGNPREIQDLEEVQNGEQDRVDPILFIRDDTNNTNKYVVIDDMIIAKDPKYNGKDSRAGLLNAAWPNGIVPYSFALTIIPQQRVMVAQAIAEIASRTCLQFRPATKDDAYWLVFQNDPLNQGCSSYVGWQNRKNQAVQLSPQCSKGNAIHEIIHAVGFFHEQTRNDRDEYVIVYYENVQPGYENNFRKEADMVPPPETSTFEVQYNYDSIMHYGKTYFSKNGKPTIEVLDNPGALGKGDNIGQRDFISSGDVEMLNRKYECPTLEQVEEAMPSPTPSSKPPGNPNINNPMCQFSPNLPMCK